MFLVFFSLAYVFGGARVNRNDTWPYHSVIINTSEPTLDEPSRSEFTDKLHGGSPYQLTWTSRTNIAF